MKKLPNNLKFKDLIKEVKDHYSNLDPLINFDERQKKQFFKENKEKIEKFILLIINKDFSDLSDTQIYHSLIGPFYELLIKTCILKENWTGYLKTYNSDRDKRSFEYAKNTLMKTLKDKELNNKQINRIKNQQEH